MKISFYIGILTVLFCSCDQFSEETFKKLSPSRTGIDFTNELVENDTLNYTVFPYMYMGGGVSVGDINNDGLDDIFFCGNLVPNRLYLNKGNMRFTDISEQAGIMGNHQWFTGSTMADVNNDGWLDIYVCVSAKYQPSDNLLFINNQDNTFTESGKSFGINDKSSSVQATFFDYNNDGFLDLFVANYPIVLVSMGVEFYSNKIKGNKYEESGHLYRNNGNNTFTDVTDETGVRNFGMSIGIVAMDFNNDGWKDLYISNDFNPPDNFYLNRGDGTFREIVKEATFQTSIFGMGFDAADFNNDGLIDLFQIDMTPEDHFRRMVNVIPMRQKTFDQSLDLGLHYQYMQNSLQLNNGVFDSIPLYSNISLFSEVAYTDWSWGGVFLDMDNDGNKDLFVTNGVLKDINNRDILDDPNSNVYFRQMKEYRPELFPSTPVRNYAFKNNGNLTFTNKSDDWGFKELNLANGMSYSDLDNDGDLDIVISLVNEVSAIYENKAVIQDHHYIKIKLNGPNTNLFGLGSTIRVKTGDTTQYQELTLTRGYQSSVPATLHFGLGPKDIIDELTVIWPDRKEQVINNIKADQTIELKYKDAVAQDNKTLQKSIFKDITAEAGINFIHHEDHYDDYEFEPLLPYKNSQMGPGLAIGDIDKDGLDDFFVGNGAGFKAAMYRQTGKGTFKEIPGPWTDDSDQEDTGALLFDADGDGRLDLYVVSGGNDNNRSEEFYQDRLYLNTENGFIKSRNILPDPLKQSGKCVKAADFDKDGDLDLFVGGRITPANYPFPASSFILANNGRHGADLRFENVTDKLAPELKNLGLVTDALWDDFNGDGDIDLIVVGEWMGIRFFENTPDGFTDISERMGFKETVGLWFSVESIDMDQDGDNDYLVGNLGLNYKYKTSKTEPFEIFAHDYDVNGKTDIVLSYGEDGKSYPVNSFDVTSGQIPAIGIRYKNYENFARATLTEIYGEKMLNASLHYKANTFAHHWIENTGNGIFKMHPLPDRAQLSSINAIAGFHKEANGTMFLVAGNLYGSEAETPRNDASIGLLLHANDLGEIMVVPPSKSGLVVKGEVKAIGKIKLASGRDGFLFAINNDSMKLIELQVYPSPQ
ncbi:MAG: VCBS repeat-containing protein [Bacteroidales bacterium]|nr:VCBS repeat-containing protein [Bacteroidales bacterium]